MTADSIPYLAWDQFSFWFSFPHLKQTSLWPFRKMPRPRFLALIAERPYLSAALWNTWTSGWDCLAAFATSPNIVPFLGWKSRTMTAHFSYPLREHADGLWYAPTELGTVLVICSRESSLVLAKKSGKLVRDSGKTSWCIPLQLFQYLWLTIECWRLFSRIHGQFSFDSKVQVLINSAADLEGPLSLFLGIGPRQPWFSGQVG